MCREFVTFKSVFEKDMRKYVLLLIAAAMSVAAHAQLLWRVSGGGLERPSYVFGTHHIAPLSVLDSIAEMRTAIRKTEQVCGEVSLADMQGAMQQMAAAMMLPDGVALDGLLDAKEFAETDSVMRRYTGVGLDNPAVLRMKPAALSAQLSVAVSRQLFHPGCDPSEPLDSYLQTEALREGKPARGLETVGRQLDVLFGAPLERQTEQLVCTVENIGWNAVLAQRLADAYMKRDLDALQTVMETKSGSSCDTAPEEEEQLIYARNAAWAAQMPAIMKERPTLFAVGAGHLPGDRGLLKLLEGMGYKVEGLD